MGKSEVATEKAKYVYLYRKLHLRIYKNFNEFKTLL